MAVEPETELQDTGAQRATAEAPVSRPPAPASGGGLSQTQAAFEPSSTQLPLPGESSDAGVIELDGLSMRFGRNQVLDNLQAKLTGRCIGLLGPNGAGKTTLLNALLSFYKPTSGTARIFGKDILKGNKEVRRLIGFMPERDAFVSGMTGVRFVRMMAEISGLSSADALERAHEVFFYTGLGEARYRKVDTYLDRDEADGQAGTGPGSRAEAAIPRRANQWS